MFRDTSEELARLEAELLAEEEPDLTEPEYEDPENTFFDFDEHNEDTEEDWDDAVPAQPDYHAYNTDVTDEDLDSYAEAVRTPSRPGCTVGLVLLLCLLTLGIVAMVAVFLRREGLL